MAIVETLAQRQKYSKNLGVRPYAFLPKEGSNDDWPRSPSYARPIRENRMYGIADAALIESAIDRSFSDEISETLAIGFDLELKSYFKSIAYAAICIAGASFFAGVSLNLAIHHLYLYVIPAVLAAVISGAVALGRVEEYRTAYKNLALQSEKPD